MQYSQLPTKFPIPWGANAAGSYITTIPVNSQIGIANGRASLNDGFVPLNFLPVGAGGTPPFGQDMNGILNQITLWSRWQNAGGLTKYDAAFSTSVGGYPFGAFLASTTAGGAWLCTQDNNTNNPDVVATGWVQIGAGVSQVISVGTDAGSANVMTATVTPVPTAYNDGAIFLIQKAAFTNNGVMTGKIATLSTNPIVMPDGSPMPAGAWPASGMALLEWNQSRTSLVLLTPTATAAANGGLQATAEGVFSLNIAGLLAPSGALSINDLLAQRVLTDGVDRQVTLAQLAKTIGVGLGQFLGGNGYQYLPGGILVQWGTFAPSTLATVTPYTISFPIPFPTNCFMVTTGLSGYPTNNTLQFVGSAKSQTLNSFVYEGQNMFNSIANIGLSVPWFAIGN